LFYDHDGKQVKQDIPCILTQKELTDGQVNLEGNLQINGEPLSQEDVNFLKEERINDL